MIRRRDPFRLSFLVVLAVSLSFSVMPSSSLAGIMTKGMEEGRKLIFNGAVTLEEGREKLMGDLAEQREMKKGFRERGEWKIVEGEKLIRQGSQMMLDGEKGLQTETVMKGRKLMLDGAEMIIDGKKKLLQDLAKKRIIKKDSEFEGKQMMIDGEDMILKGQSLMQ